MPIHSKEVMSASYSATKTVNPEREPVSPPMQHLHRSSQYSSPSLLGLPPEIRLQVLRRLLLIDYNFCRATRLPRSEQEVEKQVQCLETGSMFNSPLLRANDEFELDGTAPWISECSLHTAILFCCKKIYQESIHILHHENKYLAVQSSMNLRLLLRKFGVKAWGPLEHQRISGYTTKHHPEGGKGRLEPILTFILGSKRNSPVYLCSFKDIISIRLALWLLPQTSFAQNLTLSLHFRNNLHLPALGWTVPTEPEDFTHNEIFPWFLANLKDIYCGNYYSPSLADTVRRLRLKEDLGLLQQRRDDVNNGQEKELKLFCVICQYLESALAQAERLLSRGRRHDARYRYEGILFEAAALVKMASKLVDKGVVMSMPYLNRTTRLLSLPSVRLAYLDHADATTTTNSTISLPHCSHVSVVANSLEEAAQGSQDESPDVGLGKALAPNATSSSPEQTSARISAILHALMALRLKQCTRDAREWRIRLQTLLMALFSDNKDYKRADLCFREVWRDLVKCRDIFIKSEQASIRNKAMALEVMINDFDTFIYRTKNSRDYKRSTEAFEKVIMVIWGEMQVVDVDEDGV